jgi:hypothetical protein
MDPCSPASSSARVSVVNVSNKAVYIIVTGIENAGKVR